MSDQDYYPDKEKVSAADFATEVEASPDRVIAKRFGVLGPFLSKLFESGVEARGVERVPENQRETKNTWNKVAPHPDSDVPPELQRATLHLNYPPSYVVVGVYRLFTDESLYKPAWDKCRHGARALTVGLIWVSLTFRIQMYAIRAIIKHPSSLLSFSYISRLSETATDFSEETFLGIELPFQVSTCHLYTHLLSLPQHPDCSTTCLGSNNASRGKGPEFWQPYVEEWDVPLVVKEGFGERLGNIFETWIVGMVVKKGVRGDVVLLLPLSLYPFVAMGTARYLHKPYFKAKNMPPHQEAVFIEERKWDYRLFGFAAALLEGLPIIRLAFTVSNRIGAAMCAHAPHALIAVGLQISRNANIISLLSDAMATRA
ncbi:hypothetical protein F5I97DRAFT_1830177 [Phlebopus sp. FC_14]|nr:hypothetical protein F5I97DRAFT_1830177 [Phlebopus sp. FC_14]